MSPEDKHLTFIFNMEIFLLLVNVPFSLVIKQKYNICLIGHKQGFTDGLKLKLTHV